jgi:predicted O-linked N-acetylglucosamine transferase (SPINDLY family)
MPAQFHGLMHRADVFLDTIGFSGFNTAMQAIESNLPIVTKEGRFLRGRLASGILKQMGMQELVVTSEDEYVELAVRIAGNRSYRNELSTRIAREKQVLFNDLEPLRALEDFLIQAVERSRAAAAS